MSVWADSRAWEAGQRPLLHVTNKNHRVSELDPASVFRCKKESGEPEHVQDFVTFIYLGSSFQI